MARLLAEGALLIEMAGRNGVLRCYEVTPDPATLVLELVAGGTLAERLAESERVAAQAAAEPINWLPIFRSVARAVAYAHSRAIIHRDLKPSNILFTSEGELRLADFGVAVRRGARSTADGWEDIDVGTLGYAAPELLRDPATANTETVDIFALGALLHEMVLGSPPHMMHGHETEPDLRERIIGGAPRDITPREALASPALRQLLDRALAPDPDGRPQSVAELLALIDAL